MIPDIKPILNKMIAEIASRNMYYGTRVPASIIRQFEIDEDETHCGVLVPYWLSVLEYGRGTRKGIQSHDLWKRIYAWMERRNMFRNARGQFLNQEQRIRKAKALTWYINKHGTQQFRRHVYIDIYTTARRKALVEIDREFAEQIDFITMNVI